MATQPIEGSAIAAFPTTPPMPAVARILARFERDQLAGFIAVALDLLDTIDGDPEAEDNADREATDGDGNDQAWVEWTSMRAAQKRGHNLLAGEEDDEDDDPNGGEIDEDVPGFTKRDLALAKALGSGAGCSISDPGGCQHD